MLTEASYHTAIYAYTGAALVALLSLVWWLRRSWSRAWRLLLLLAGAALLLTPAYPQEGVDTLAPALVVAAFQILTDGVDSGISPGVTLGVQDSGVFEFLSDVSGTYAIFIDIDQDDVRTVLLDLE